MAQKLKPPPGAVLQPRGSMPRLTELWAIVATDPEDANEGVITVGINGFPMPLLASDKERLAEIKRLGKMWSERNGIPIRLAHFTTRYDEDMD